MVITIKELKELSKKLQLNLGQTDLHYMHHLFLFILSKTFPNSFVFKGGTSLMICYNLDRFSEDLDFNIVKDVNIDKVLKEVVTFFHKVGYESSYTFKRNTHSSQTYIFYIKGPLYMGKTESQTTIELDFSNREDMYLEFIPKKITHFFDEFPQFYFNTLTLEEIFAEKIRCILTRDKARDVYDLHYLITRKISLNIDLINKKLNPYNLKYNHNEVLKAIKKKEKIWKKELQYLLQIVPLFDDIESEIETYLQNQN
ncbi:MAG: nucleotidyl transferase AbiEii/AbiGii toxin family protein [Nanoarchaeota archaeon]|nr:nucleotidyl transferase AbiEii/AbiGii toxin family protein [Nanoarchaeota archaeon]